MISKKRLIYISLGIVLLLGVAAITYIATSKPRAEVAATLHDFGSFSEDQCPSHTFLIKNIGSRPLEITNVHPQCACAATAYDRLIPPGGQGAVTLSIRPFTLRGQFAKKTEVFLNDPDHSRLVFTLKGISRLLIEVEPSHVIHFRGKPGEDLHRQVRLISHLPESWEVSSFKTNIPQFIDVNLHPSEPGKSYVVEVRQKRREPGKYQGMIELFTTVPKRPHLVLRVFGEVVAP
jgi:Protein of unknown function (DUF1573)